MKDLIIQQTISELLEKHRHLVLHDANEAETREKLINRILYEILGWVPDDVSFEERVSEDGKTKYADYIIRTANTAFLLEAKRIGDGFLEVPSKRRVKLTGQIIQGKTGDAIRQARDYCRTKSIAYAVVTNGAQWIIFPAVRTDQVDFASSSAVVFDSLERALGSEHEFFHSLLSREGVINGILETELIGRNEDQLEERRLKAFFKSTYTKPVNPIYPLIESAIVASFTDSIIDKDDDLLDKCYVKTAERIKFDNRIQMHLNKREPLFNSQPKRPMKKKEATALADALSNAITSLRPIAVLILGPVGAGKTTFLHYTKRISAKAFFEKRLDKEYPHWIEADFRKFSQNESPVDFLVGRIFQYLKDDPFFSDYNRAIRSAYKIDIDTLKKGPMYLVAQDEKSFNEKIAQVITQDYNNVKPYVEKLITYASTKTPVFLVVDNIDQFESEKIQSDIFADAIALASRLGMNLVVSMRESTYVRHRHSPTFDAFDFDPIQLEPPQIPPILSRRFFVARQLLSGISGEFTALNGALFKVNDLSIFINLVQESVLGTEVGHRIDVLANNDVRLALRMTREFLERGYTDPAKALQHYNQNNKYTLPKHEAFRAILLGNQSVYSEEYSVIGNPFDARLSKTNAQMLRLFLLAAMVKMSTESAFQYLDGPTIRETLRTIGFADKHILKVLDDLCRLRFMHTSSHGPADFMCSYYPSRLGGYVVRELIGDFTFVENTLMDTFISSSAMWNELRTLSEGIREERDTVKKMRLRVERAKKFFQYMKELYAEILNEAQRRALPSEWCTNPLDGTEAKLRNHCDTAIRSAERNYGSKQH